MNLNLKTPNSFQEAVNFLHELLNEGERDQLMMCLEKNLYLQYSNLRKKLINELGLWKDTLLKHNLNKMGFIHPDDMSLTIIEAYRARLRKEEYNINQKIDEYKAYWDKIDNENICSD